MYYHICMGWRTGLEMDIVGKAAIEALLDEFVHDFYTRALCCVAHFTSIQYTSLQTPIVSSPLRSNTVSASATSQSASLPT